MSNSLYLAVGFFGGTLLGVALMALVTAGELARGVRGSTAKAGSRARDRSLS